MVFSPRVVFPRSLSPRLGKCLRSRSWTPCRENDGGLTRANQLRTIGQWPLAIEAGGAARDPDPSIDLVHAAGDLRILIDFRATTKAKRPGQPTLRLIYQSLDCLATLANRPVAWCAAAIRVLGAGSSSVPMPEFALLVERQIRASR
jgi:hypothetical protein